ncbi:hypothetical protein Tco_1121066 [Tanacetum coccineum]|uniref:Uncharacterized protein n=1 Tax=Tanacetum coccineum TaxID=301880 RepID=A0ABQ5IX15_9ASTR
MLRPPAVELIFLKSIHIRQLPSAFFTRTGFDIQVGYFTGLTIPALNHSVTSLVIARLFSEQNTLLFCLTGVTDGLACRECLMILFGTPVISDGSHAKMSLFLFNKLFNWASPSGERFFPITTNCSG